MSEQTVTHNDFFSETGKFLLEKPLYVIVENRW